MLKVTLLYARASLNGSLQSVNVDLEDRFFCGLEDFNPFRNIQFITFKNHFSVARSNEIFLKWLSKTGSTAQPSVSWNTEALIPDTFSKT